MKLNNKILTTIFNISVLPLKNIYKNNSISKASLKTVPLTIALASIFLYSLSDFSISDLKNDVPPLTVVPVLEKQLKEQEKQIKNISIRNLNKDCLEKKKKDIKEIITTVDKLNINPDNKFFIIEKIDHKELSDKTEIHIKSTSTVDFKQVLSVLILDELFYLKSYENQKAIIVKKSICK